ncbi:MAG: hypothetical protein ACRD0U_12570, partial [Acidimicrobiales bacterium]
MTDNQLALGVPAPSGPHGTSLPRWIPAEDLKALLASGDTSTALGRRDHAIVVLLARLGLRDGEVAGLRLDDLDWSAAIPTKRCDRAVVSFLTEPEADAVLASPDQASWTGRRDHALLLEALQTGLRISELTGLRNTDVELRAGAHVRCWYRCGWRRWLPASVPTNGRRCRAGWWRRAV